jgi:hypothetical protein
MSAIRLPAREVGLERLAARVGPITPIVVRRRIGTAVAIARRASRDALSAPGMLGKQLAQAGLVVGSRRTS